ncbi:MAG: ABC transporter ATP-binding protein [Puniceicoccaceae bacterium]
MEEPASPENTLLSVDKLCISIGQPAVEAVRGIRFAINRGEILGLAGESGSGKSVTALSLTRLLPPSASPGYSGEVELNGVPGNLLEMTESRLRQIRGPRIAYVFQEPSSSFNPVFSIRSHLEEILKLQGVGGKPRLAAIRQAMEEVGIEPSQENLEAYPGSFSGGMLQRMAIACALLYKPDLLIADEPTTALDTSTQKRIVELLMQLNREHNMAILFISHNLGLLKQLAGRLLVMKSGEIVESGKADAVLRSPRHAYTRELVRSIPKLKLAGDDH